MRRIIVFLLVMVAAGCADSDEEVCCSCPVDNACTTASHDRCREVFIMHQGKDSILVDSRGGTHR